MHSNCPNCDAVLSYEGGLHCDYCGARFEPPRDDLTLRVDVPDVDAEVLYDILGRAWRRGASPA